MNNNNPVKIMDLPYLEEIKGKELGETLCNLFTYLIPADMQRPVDIDPRKIRLNYHDCKKLIELTQKGVDDEQELKVSLLWLNQGPAGDKDVPRGKIYLYEDYMKPANNANNKKVG